MAAYLGTLRELLAEPALVAAIDQYRKCKSQEGVIAVVLDGQVARDLIKKGMYASDTCNESVRC